MKTSIFLAASGAAMTLAAALDKRAMETVWDVKWVTVTVTAGQEPPAQTPGQFFEAPDAAPAPVFSTVTPDVAPKPEEKIVIEESSPEPEPTPAPAPAPVPAPAPAPKPEAETQPVAAPAGNSMKEASLYHHNIHRQNHSAPALQWGQKYSDYALQTAKTCVFEHDLTPGGGGYGQNLAMWGATNGDDLGESKAVARAITTQWYNGELNAYSPNFYGNEPDMGRFSVWGHFSQLVWVDTEELGCAVHYCPKGTMNDDVGVWYSVCNYFPAGNMAGAFSKNVLPPGSADVVTA